MIYGRPEVDLLYYLQQGKGKWDYRRDNPSAAYNQFPDLL